jgi:putative membrane protein
MKRHMAVALAVAAIAVVMAPGAAMSANPLHRAKNAITGKAPSDATFIKEAAQGGMAEVELGRLGVERAESPDVRQFAQRMVDDHSKANDELMEIASKKGVAVPKDLDPKHKAAKDRLSKLSGRDFDRAFMRDMMSDHDHDVTAFQKQSAKGHDPELKAWIDKTLPTLKEHKQLAKDTANKVGATLQGKATGVLHRITRRGGSRYQGEATR